MGKGDGKGGCGPTPPGPDCTYKWPKPVKCAVVSSFILFNFLALLFSVLAPHMPWLHVNVQSGTCRLKEQPSCSFTVEIGPTSGLGIRDTVCPQTYEDINSEATSFAVGGCRAYDKWASEKHSFDPFQDSSFQCEDLENLRDTLSSMDSGDSSDCGNGYQDPYCEEYRHEGCEGGGCSCDEGWSGFYCDTPTAGDDYCGNGYQDSDCNDYQYESCEGGGCRCHEGWSGFYCDTPIAYVYCGNGYQDSNCHDYQYEGCEGGGCYCYQGWSGSNCDTPAVNCGNGYQDSHCDEYRHQGCEGGGCSCYQGWSGFNCGEEEGINQCVENENINDMNGAFKIISGCCEITSNGGTANCIQSPNFPNSYTHNEVCEIEVLASNTAISIKELDIEECCDHFEIFSFGSSDPTYSSNTLSSVHDCMDGRILQAGDTLKWLTDGSVSEHGWLLCDDGGGSISSQCDQAAPTAVVTTTAARRQRALLGNEGRGAAAKTHESKTKARKTQPAVDHANSAAGPSKSFALMEKFPDQSKLVQDKLQRLAFLLGEIDRRSREHWLLKWLVAPDDFTSVGGNEHERRLHMACVEHEHSPFEQDESEDSVRSSQGSSSTNMQDSADLAGEALIIGKFLIGVFTCAIPPGLDLKAGMLRTNDCDYSIDWNILGSCAIDVIVGWGSEMSWAQERCGPMYKVQISGYISRVHYLAQQTLLAPLLVIFFTLCFLPCNLCKCSECCNSHKCMSCLGRVAHSFMLVAAVAASMVFIIVASFLSRMCATARNDEASGYMAIAMQYLAEAITGMGTTNVEEALGGSFSAQIVPGAGINLGIGSIALILLAQVLQIIFPASCFPWKATPNASVPNDNSAITTQGVGVEATPVQAQPVVAAPVVVTAPAVLVENIRESCHPSMLGWIQDLGMPDQYIDKTLAAFSAMGARQRPDLRYVAETEIDTLDLPPAETAMLKKALGDYKSSE